MTCTASHVKCSYAMLQCMRLVLCVYWMRNILHCKFPSRELASSVIQSGVSDSTGDPLLRHLIDLSVITSFRNTSFALLYALQT